MSENRLRPMGRRVYIVLVEDERQVWYDLAGSLREDEPVSAPEWHPDEVEQFLGPLIHED